MTDPNRMLSWCMISDYRAQFGLISDFESSCTIDGGNVLYSFLVDQPISNHTTSYIKFTHVEPTVIQETITEGNTDLMVFGSGFDVDHNNKLECHFTAGTSYMQVVTAQVTSLNHISCTIPYDVYQFGVSGKF